MDNVGYRIKEIRKDYKLTQKSFGQQIGINDSAVSMVEKNERSISESVIKNIITRFCVNEAWLRDGVGEKYNKELQKQKEFMENELGFMTDTLMDKQRAFFNRLKDYDEDDRLEMISALEEIYSLLDAPDLDEDTYFEYFETISGMLFEIDRYIESLKSDAGISPGTVNKYIESVRTDLIHILSILLPDADTSSFESQTAGDGEDIPDGDRALLDLFHSLDASAQEEIKELMLFKQSRSDPLKRKKKLSESGHGEEAATGEEVNQKMA